MPLPTALSAGTGILVTATQVRKKSPVHVYEDGGYYKVVLTATCGKGETVTVERTIAVALTPYVLLTGGPTAENGKTWKLAAAHSSI
jgi:PKD repeat protein